MQVLSFIVAIIFSIRFYSGTAPVMTPMIQRALDGRLSTVITLFKILLILKVFVLVIIGHLPRQIHLTLCRRWRGLGSGLEQRPFLQARRLSNHICVLSFSKSILHFFDKTRYVKGLHRSGIDKNTGNNWLRVEQPKETKIVFKQVLVALIMFIIFTVMMKLRQCLLQ